MDSTTRIALLIDADNVSVEVLRQVLHKLGLSAARLQHRRAYGSVQKAAEFAEVCRDHAIRFLPSTFAGPNATDIAMAIDAVELVLRQPVDEVVIVSSDMDYSPLIVRLRELGCRVTGYGQQGKSGRDIERDYERVYDQFEVIGLAKVRSAARSSSRAAAPLETVAPAAPISTRARRPAARVAIPVPLTVPTEAPAVETPPVRSTPSRRRPAAKTPPAAKALAPLAAAPRALPVAVEAVLDACPDLRGGTAVRLNGVAVALRERGLLTKSGKTTSFFKKLEAHFALLPIEKPESVRFLGGAPAGD
ncbi:MAG: NYN domain-containing protein [Burkholderiaceae bacterium]|nr:NYN domain-containing protein [Burkholderiaceae bacterium]